MTSAVSSRRLEQALAAAGSPVSADEFLAILSDAVASTDTMTALERDFVIEHGGVAANVFDPDRLTAARRRIAAEAAQADVAATRDGLTTSEVAKLLGTASANVRRGLARGDLYSSGLRRGREHVFPAWQFQDGGAVPHMREVIAALPADMHPLDVAAFMTESREGLGGRNVAQWLAGGGAVDPVIRLAAGLARL